MKNWARIIGLAGAVLLAAGCRQDTPVPAPQAAKGGRVDKIVKTEAEWKKILTPEQFKVLRLHETERPGTGEYCELHEAGMYHCAGCDLPLFESGRKFESGTGWPSYFQPITPDAIETTTDTSYGMKRVEVHCARCGGHLGHVFEDGPPPTGLRYCINSVALKFVKATAKK